MKIESFKAATEAGEIYAHLISEQEQIEEALREFAGRHKSQIGREKTLDRIVIGFRYVPPAVKVADEPAAIDQVEAIGHGALVETVRRLDRVALKRLLKKASQKVAETFAGFGITYRESDEAFFVKLSRNGKES